MAGVTKKVSVLLDEPDYERFEIYCKKQGFKKSTLVAKLIRDHLQADVTVKEPTVEYKPSNNRPKIAR